MQPWILHEYYDKSWAWHLHIVYSLYKPNRVIPLSKRGSFVFQIGWGSECKKWRRKWLRAPVGSQPRLRLRLLTVCFSFWVADKHIQCSLSFRCFSVRTLGLSFKFQWCRAQIGTPSRRARRGNIINYYLELQLKDCEKGRVWGYIEWLMFYVVFFPLAKWAYQWTFICTHSAKY